MAEEELLTPTDNYLAAGVHIGTKFRTKSMQPFIYKVNQNGLAVLDIQKINARIENAGKFLANYEPEDILVVSRRENGWKAVDAFSKITNVKTFTGRYPAGVMTNPILKNFSEPKVLLVTDPWPDKNAVNDALQIGIPVVALCDSNNTTDKIDLVIPCNNKGAKSIGLILYLLAEIYMKEKGLLDRKKKLETPLEDFYDG